MNRYELLTSIKEDYIRNLKLEIEKKEKENVFKQNLRSIKQPLFNSHNTTFDSYTFDVTFKINIQNYASWCFTFILIIPDDSLVSKCRSSALFSTLSKNCGIKYL